MNNAHMPANFTSNAWGQSAREGDNAKPVIEARSGASLSIQEAADGLNQPEQEILSFIQNRRLIAYPAIGDGSLRLPLWQFSGTGIHPWVAELTHAYGHSGWGLLDFLTVPRIDQADTASYLDLLRSNPDTFFPVVKAAAARTNAE
jgi:hypothetical protein